MSLRLDKFESNISKAISNLKKLEDSTKKSSDSMDKSVNTSVNNISKAYKLWEKSSGQSATASEKHGKKVESLSKQMGVLDTAISKSEKELGKIEQKYGVNSQEAEEYRSKVLDLKLSHAELGESLDKTNKEFAKTGIQTKTLGEKFRDLDDECAKIDKKFEVFDKVGDKFSNFGKKMTVGVTLPVVGAGIAAGKMASDMQQGVSKVTTVADMSKISVDKITSSIIDMSNQTGISTNELNESLYQTISAGVDTAHSVEFLSDATKLAEAGFADIGPTIDALTSILNAYGLEATETTRISDVLIQAQNLGKLSVSELSGAIGRVIPSAKNANVSIEQLSSAYVEMTKNGVSVNESTTYINSLFNEMSKSGTKVDKTLKQIAGKSFPQLMKEGKSVGDVLALLDDHAKKNNLSLGDIFGSAEAAKAGLILASEGGKKFNGTLEQLQSSAGSTDKAFETMSNTTEYKFRKAMNQAKNSIMQFGITAMPAITKVIEKVSDMLEKFSNLSPTTQEWIMNAALMVAAIGPLSSGIGGLIKGITGLGKGFSKAKKALSIFGTGAEAATTVTSGLGKAAAVTGGAKGIGALIGGLGGFLSTAAPVIAAGGILVGSFSLMRKSFKETAESAKAEVTPAFKEVVNGVEGLSEEAKGFIIDLQERMSSIEAKQIVFKADGKYVIEEFIQVKNELFTLMDETTAKINENLGKIKDEYPSYYSTLSEEEKKHFNEKRQRHMEESNKEIEAINKNKKEILEIEKKAADEKREINEKESQRMIEIAQETAQKRMEAEFKGTEEWKALVKSKSEFEASASIETGKVVIQNSQDVRDKQIEAINQKFEKDKEYIENLTNVDAVFKEDQLQKAETHKNDQIQKSHETYEGILSEVRQKYPEITDFIDLETGKILSIEEAQRQKHELGVRQQCETDVNLNEQKFNTLNMMNNAHSGNVESNLGQCINAWKMYIANSDAKIKELDRQLANGEIDIADYQRKVNSLEANKRYARDMISGLLDLLNQFANNKIGAQELQRAINELQSKTITITTQYHTVGKPPEVTGKPQMVGPRNAGLFSLPTFADNELTRVIAHDSKTGSYGEVMDLPGGTRIYPSDVSMRMARETARGIVEEFTKDLKNSTGFSGEIIVPVILDGKEIARVTAPFMSNEFANRMQRKR